MMSATLIGGLVGIGSAVVGIVFGTITYQLWKERRSKGSVMARQKISTAAGTCREPGCGRALGVESWEYDGFCAIHTDQLFGFIEALEQQAQQAGMTPGELLARQWLGEQPMPSSQRGVSHGTSEDQHRRA